jgi:hypothetical protein
MPFERKSCKKCGREDGVRLKDGVCGFCRELDASCEEAAQRGRLEERERIARIVDRWEPYAGVFSRTDLASFIRRGERL